MARDKNKNYNKGFTQHYLPVGDFLIVDDGMAGKPTDQKKVVEKASKNSAGFTLIEILVVIAIISLLSSVALIAFQSAQAKGRNVRRLGDMTQMNTALELYFNSYKGYPSSTNGQPVPITQDFTMTIPHAPVTPDGACDGLTHSSEVTINNGGQPVNANTYYYIAEGAGYAGANGAIVYPSYTYYFCLGDVTGGFAAGERVLTPTGIK